MSYAQWRPPNLEQTGREGPKEGHQVPPPVRPRGCAHPGGNFTIVGAGESASKMVEKFTIVGAGVVELVTHHVVL